MKKFRKSFLTICFTFIIFSFGVSTVTAPVQASLQDDLDAVQQQLDDVRKAKQDLQNQLDNNQYLLDGYSAQASKLYGEVLVFQQDIDELELEIEELELNIGLLEDKIKEAQEEIEQSEETIGELESESKFRIKDSYVNFRLTGDGQVSGDNILSVESINEYFKNTQYMSKIQEDTNDILRNLTFLQRELDDKREVLAEKKKNLDKEKTEVDVKRDNLAKKRDELQVQMNIYYAEMASIQNSISGQQNAILAFSQEEIELKAEADRIQQDILNSYNPVGDGQYVTAGTYVGTQGCTGLCTGPHLHFSVQINNGWQNPCSHLPGGGPVSGCGGGSTLEKWPINSGTFTSGYGERCFNWGGSLYCDFHTGIDIAGPGGSPIFAAHDGFAYKGVDPYGALYVIVCENQSCQSGIKTGYWHLSSY